jgi:hypothetical protein
MANEFVIKNGFISNGGSQVNGDFSVKGSVSSTQGSILGGYIRNLDSVAVTPSTGTTSADTSNVSILKIQRNGNATFNLSDGISGQRLTVYCSTGVSGRVDIIPNTSTGWSQFTINNVGDCVDLIYDSAAGWIITGNFGGTIT